MMTERAYASMRAIDRDVDFLLLVSAASILALYMLQSVVSYVLRTFQGK